ncbi:hypothetical protein KPL78_18785 [Roseomonas sp. HJA6]|uniref:Uncharacterized protein n=1 Tax=Roseomonas alba TaxID=2846776 RepID=A0ABS7AC82_9PROT|nr:hypothetical protein [Neoroseomonas alba]MBW6399913.1 hypothetical protein [Neoroseomonas alba]
MDEIDKKSEDTRAYTFQLAMRQPQYLTDPVEFVERGSLDAYSVAREGLALGVVPFWTEGISPILLKWWSSERVPAVKASLVEHFSRFSDRSSDYKGLALEAYRSSGRDDALRAQIEIASGGTTLYAELQRYKRSEREREILPGLAGGATGMAAVSINSGGGPITIGQLGDHGTNFGELKTLVATKAPEGDQISEILKKTIADLEGIPPDVREEVSRSIKAEVVERKPGFVSRIGANLRRIAGVGANMGATAEKLVALAELWDRIQ